MEQKSCWLVNTKLIVSSAKHFDYKVKHRHTQSMSSQNYASFSQFRSVAQSRLTLCDPMDCSTPGLGVYSNSCPLSRWCHPTISSSVIPFSSCLQSFPALGSFAMSSVLHIRWPKYWSFSFSISPSNEQSGLVSFRMNWLDLLAVQGTLKSLSNTTVQKHQFFDT